MKTLVIGGTGMIGCHAATLLTDRGHDVTIGARSAPAEESPVAGYPVLLGDYATGGLTEAEPGAVRRGRLRGRARTCAT